MAKRLEAHWSIKSAIMFLFLIIASLLFGCARPTEAPPTLTRTPFSYVVLVVAEDSQERIYGADVELEVPGGGPTLSAKTDAEGYAMLLIDPEYLKQPAMLRVMARDYKDYDRYIDLRNDNLPPRIDLKKESVSQLAADTPKPVPRSTDTPVPTSTPTSTSTPDPTPTRVFVEASRDLSLKSIPSFRQRGREVVDKGTLYTIVNGYIDDESREWLEIETMAGQRGWTLLDEGIPAETPVAGAEELLAQEIPTIASGEVPATPEAFPPPALIFPKTEHKAVLHDPVLLEWEWDEPLEKGWFFSVRIGQDAETGHPNELVPCFHDKISFSNVYEGDLSEFCQPGRYYWEVVVAARNEEFIEKHETTKFDPEEVKEFTEISCVSTREYFDYVGPVPSDTPTPPPTNTPEPTPTDTPGPSDDPDPEAEEVNPIPESGP